MTNGWPRGARGAVARACRCLCVGDTRGQYWSAERPQKWLLLELWRYMPSAGMLFWLVPALVGHAVGGGVTGVRAGDGIIRRYFMGPFRE